MSILEKYEYKSILKNPNSNNIKIKFEKIIKDRTINVTKAGYKLLTYLFKGSGDLIIDL